MQVELQPRKTALQSGPGRIKLGTISSLETDMGRLECRFCEKDFAYDPFSPFCPDCREPLLVPSPEKPRAFHPDKALSLDRFREFLPLPEIDPALSLGEGSTPLLALDRLSAKLGLPALFAKNETMNPTLSFKDRGTAVAVQNARRMGFKRIGTVSTGNMAASTAAYGARAGLETIVLLKEGTPEENILMAGIHRPRLIVVEGDYGRLFRESLVLGRKHGILFMNSIDPFRIEGYKLTGFEIFLQTGGRIPDYLFLPLSSGGHLVGLLKSFIELKQLGFADRIPVVVGVQAEGCAPLARAFAAGAPRFSPFENPGTIAHAISNPHPPAGNLVLKMMKEQGGLITAVSDREMLKAQGLLASEGLFCQPDSATTLAALVNLTRSKVVPRDAAAVLVVTGSGLKNLKVLEGSPLPRLRVTLAGLEDALEGRTTDA
jgi:threonine synthase